MRYPKEILAFFLPTTLSAKSKIRVTAANNRRRVRIRASRSPWVTPSNCILLWVRLILGLLFGFEPGPPAELPGEKFKNCFTLVKINRKIKI